MLSYLRFRAPIRGLRRLSTQTEPSLAQLLKETKEKFGQIPSVALKIDSLTPLAPTSADLSQFVPKTVTIGIVQSETMPRDLLLQCIIDDPLGDDSTWKKPLRKYGEQHPENNFRVTYSSVYRRRDLALFGVKAPFLNKDLRLIPKEGQEGPSPLKRELFNDIDLVSIHNEGFTNTDTTAAEADELSDMMSTKTLGDHGGAPKRSDIQLYIYAKETEGQVVPAVGGDYPFITVVDRSAQDSTHFQVNDSTVSVDLTKIHRANELFEESVQNVEEYQTLVQDSGASRLLYVLDRETSGYRPAILLLRSLLVDVNAQINEAKSQPKSQLANELRGEIGAWAQASHLELQTKVNPYMDKVFLNRFTKLSVVIYNSDELALQMADYLYDSSKEVRTSAWSRAKVQCHGSLVDSNANLNYLEGKIDGIFPSPDKLTEVQQDPLKQLKVEVTKDKLPALQSKLNNILLRDLVEIPVPVFAITTAGYIFEWIDLNTGCAIFLFSLALASYKASQNVFKAVSKFKDWYMDSLRQSIDKNLVYLEKRIDANVGEYDKDISDKQLLVKNLTEQVDKMEKADTELGV